MHICSPCIHQRIPIGFLFFVSGYIRLFADPCHPSIHPFPFSLPPFHNFHLFIHLFILSFTCFGSITRAVRARRQRNSVEKEEDEILKNPPAIKLPHLSPLSVHASTRFFLPQTSIRAETSSVCSTAAARRLGLATPAVFVTRCARRTRTCCAPTMARLTRTPASTGWTSAKPRLTSPCCTRARAMVGAFVSFFSVLSSGLLLWPIVLSFVAFACRSGLIFRLVYLLAGRSVGWCRFAVESSVSGSVALLVRQLYSCRSIG